MTDEAQMLLEFKQWMDFYSPDWMRHFTPGEIEPLRKCWFAATEKAHRPEENAPTFENLQDAPRTLLNVFTVQHEGKRADVVYASFASCIEREANSLRAAVPSPQNTMEKS